MRLIAADEASFKKTWPVTLASIHELYGVRMPLPDDRYKLAKELVSLRDISSINDIEKALRQLWDFDNRFFGGLIPFRDEDYGWAVYSLCYLCDDISVIDLLLNIYPPLLGVHIGESLGADFLTKTGSTFMDDVIAVLEGSQSFRAADDHNLFDWHGNRNNLSEEQLIDLTQRAGLKPLDNPDFPPSSVILRFTNLQATFESEGEFRSELQAFYDDLGYDISG